MQNSFTYQPCLEMTAAITAETALGPASQRVLNDEGWRNTLIAKAISGAQDIDVGLRMNHATRAAAEKWHGDRRFLNAFALALDVAGTKIGLAPLIERPDELIPKAPEDGFDFALTWREVASQAQEALLNGADFAIGIGGIVIVLDERNLQATFSWGDLVSLGWGQHLLAYLTYRTEELADVWNERLASDFKEAARCIRDLEAKRRLTMVA